MDATWDEIMADIRVRPAASSAKWSRLSRIEKSG